MRNGLSTNFRHCAPGPLLQRADGLGRERVCPRGATTGTTLQTAARSCLRGARVAGSEDWPP